MCRIARIRSFFVLAIALTVSVSARMQAQEDPNEVPLGDVARNLRKQNPAPNQVIDDDNLSDVMQQNESRQRIGSSLKYMMSGESKSFQVSAPDVTCSLAFTANVKSLLANNQYTQMDLPGEELSKVQGPATIEGDALTVSIFNGTNWHLSEVTVALTVVKKKDAQDGSAMADSSQAGATPPSADRNQNANNPLDAVRPEKKQDLTVIYHMRSGAAPWTRAVFSAPLNLAVGPGDEWHWSIVQAKGYPPQSSVPPQQATALDNGQVPVPASLLPQPSEQAGPAQDHP